MNSKVPILYSFQVQVVIDSIVWAFRGLKMPRCREMSARGYALHSVCPNFPSILYAHIFLNPDITKLQYNEYKSRE